MSNKILETLMKFQNTSYIEHIEAMLEEAMKLSSYLHFNQYFQAVAHVQNSYMVELRRIYANKFMKEGLSNSNIARLMCKDHATISYLVKTTNDKDPIRKEIIDLCENWVLDGFYPETYIDYEPSHKHKTGVRSVVKYKLKSIDNGGNNFRQNSSANTGVEEMAGS